VLVAALAIVAMPTRPAEMRDSRREVRLVIRGMAFYLDGSAEANPTLRLRTGETVRLVLRNEDRGMHHDFTIPAWKTATPLVAGVGEDAIEITAPSRGARTDYHCTPHAATMRGTIIVE
jgi:plastocyanin